MAKFVEPKVHFQDLNTLWVESKPLRAVLYFVTLFASLAVVLRKLPRANTVSQRLLVFPALAAFALCSTWKHIVIFLIEDARAHSNMTTFDWVQSSEFFVKVSLLLITTDAISSSSYQTVISSRTHAVSIYQKTIKSIYTKKVP